MSAALDLLATELADRLYPLLVQRFSDSMPSQNELLTVPQVAKELHISREKVRALINAGTLPRAKDIREMRVSRRALERYTDSLPKK